MSIVSDNGTATRIGSLGEACARVCDSGTKFSSENSDFSCRSYFPRINELMLSKWRENTERIFGVFTGDEVCSRELLIKIRTVEEKIPIPYAQV